MYHLLRSLYLHATSKEEYSILLLGLDNAGKTTLLSQIKALFNTTSTSSNASLGQTGDAPPSSTAGDTVPTVGQNVATIDLPDMYIKIWDVGGQMSLRRLWTSYYTSCHAVVFVLDSSDLGTLDEDIDLDGLPTTAGAGGNSAANGLGLLTPQTPTAGPKAWYGRRKSSYAFPRISTDTEGNGAMEQVEDDGDIGNKPPQTPITPSMITPTMSTWHHQGRLDECRAVLESVLSHPDMSGIPILVLANKQDREDCLEVVRIKEGFVRKVFEGEKGVMIRDSRVLPVSALKGTGVKEAVEWVRTRVVWNKEGRAPVMR